MPDADNALSSGLGAAILEHVVHQSWDFQDCEVDAADRFAVGSSKGTVREQNDDRAAVVEFLTPGLPNVFLLAVFDGVGGSRDGGLAASIALAATIEAFANGSKGPLSRLLETSLRHADQVVHTALRGNGLSTASVVVLGPRRDFFAANVGDSRIYIWDSEAGKLTQISEDDTLLSALERNNIKLESEVVRARGLGNSLSQALGERRSSSDELRVDVNPLEPSTHGVLVASDGAWSSGSFDIHDAVPQASTSSDLVRRLIDANEWFGGRDNLSIAACRDLDAFVGTQSASATRRSIRMWLPSGSATFVSVDRDVAPPPGEEAPSSKRKRGKWRAKDAGDENDRVEEDAGDDAGEVERFPEPQAQD